MKSDENGMSEDEFRQLAIMFGCEHSTLITILNATVTQLRMFPMESWHPSMAAMFMAVTAMKASITAAAIRGDTEVATHLQKMYEEVSAVIYKFHHDNEFTAHFFQKESEQNEKSQVDIPEVFRKAFEQ